MGAAEGGNATSIFWRAARCVTATRYERSLGDCSSTFRNSEVVRREGSAVDILSFNLLRHAWLLKNKLLQDLEIEVRAVFTNLGGRSDDRGGLGTWTHPPHLLMSAGLEDFLNLKV